MGNSLTICCCEGADDPHSGPAPTMKNSKKSNRGGSSRRDNTNDSHAGRDTQESTKNSDAPPKKKDSMVFHSEGGDDAEAFDRAFRANDIPKLVKLMDSDERIETDEQMHQWATNPRSIGALAGTQIAIKAAVTQESATPLQPFDPDMKDKVRKAAGAIPKLVKYLKSSEEDRIHTAVVALSFLCIENPLNAKAADDAGAIQPLVPLMLSPIEGLACAAASVIRNIILEDEAAKEKFVEARGVEGFVKLVELPKGYKQLDPDDTQRMLDLKLEALLTICEFLEDHTADRKIVPKYARLVREQGIETKLKDLYQFGDQELEDVADDIARSLESVLSKK
ncbi:unnamed protein product [Amoebophrya sp. A25]|nr:unnamed protein product [Amoebophrya sp. A25]|eukprot:GSA25T00016055001.1